MEPVDKELCESNRKVMDERFRRDKEDIEDLKEGQDEIKKLTIQMAELVKQNHEAIEKHGNRLDALERRPSMWWDKLLSAGISAGVAAIISAIVAMFVR